MGPFLAWLRKFLGLEARSQIDEAQPSGLRFPSLDVNDLAADLEVSAMGQRNGSANIPSSSDQSPDGFEAKIRYEIRRRVEAARGRASQIIRNVETSIKARQLTPAVKRCNELPESFLRERDVRSSKLKHEREELERELAEVQGEIDQYRTRYSISRTPRLTSQEDRNDRWLPLAAFAFVQFLANSVLFGEGSDYGLALGITLALIFAFFDITAHVILGDLSARILARDVLQRTIGVASTLMWLVTATFVNTSMVHLRLVTREHGIGGWDQWLPSVRDNTFGFEDFLSWALLAVGLLCSLLAVRAGFVWDEPIPLFRRNGRTAKLLREDIDDNKHDQATLNSALLERFRKELDTIDRRAEDHISVISDSKNRINQVVSEFTSYCSTAESTVEALIRLYQDENKVHRTADPPSFFGGPVSAEFVPALEDMVESLQGVFDQSEQDHDELRSSLPEARRQLHALAAIDVAHTREFPS